MLLISMNGLGSYVAYLILRKDEYIDGEMRSDLGYSLASLAGSGTVAMFFLRRMPWVINKHNIPAKEGFKSTIRFAKRKSLIMIS